MAKELLDEELEKVSGGFGASDFFELDPAGRATFINIHTEVGYERTMWGWGSHGGTVVEALGTYARGKYEVVVRIVFDDWPDANGRGWFWWETIGNKLDFREEKDARGKPTPYELDVEDKISNRDIICPMN